MPTETDISFGERLRQLRKAAGLVQVAPAKRVGLTPRGGLTKTPRSLGEP